MNHFAKIRAALQMMLGFGTNSEQWLTAGNALVALGELERAAAQPVAYQYAHPYFGGGKIWREEQRWNGHTSDEARALYAALPTPDARADARIAELERECAQWRDELRIYRETESARIAELEQSVTMRDTEIARLETDLELARRDGEHLRLFARIRFGYAPGDYFGICHCCRAQFIGDKRAMNCEACADKAIDEAQAGNGGEG